MSWYYTDGDDFYADGICYRLSHGTMVNSGLYPPENIRRLCRAQAGMGGPVIRDDQCREERPAYGPTQLPEFVPDRVAILYGLRQHGIDAPQSVGIKQETIRKLLDGSTRRPTASLMMQLARLFDCDVEDLMREARE